MPLGMRKRTETQKTISKIFFLHSLSIYIIIVGKMVRKRLDERVRTLIERGVVKGERSILVLVGDHGKDQVPNLHQILSKTTIGTRPNVLWCYKKELGFSTHRKKRIKKLKRDKARGLSSTASSIDTADNFELFISSTDINWCYYKDSHRVLGTTNGMLVLQDFEALTPNLMARTIETVKGGGLVIFLMRTVKSLKQLYTMTMDVHSRYRTESSGDLVPRFNERFILSLAKCQNCLVCDDELNVLPVSRKTLMSLAPGEVEKGDAGEVILRETTEEHELKELKDTLIETPHVGVLVDLAKTLDQAKALLVFLEACSEKTHSTSTVAMTAARGRGKSAAMGLCLAGAISLGYSTMAVTAPEPENLVSVFDFLCRGLKALKYQEHLDYTLSYNSASGRESIKCIVAINIHRSHRQVIQYIPPHETDKFSSAEIVAVDEAAAIPLPVVRALMNQPDRLTFLSSTVNGYEGTGRALSLKLIKELRESKGGRRAELDVANAAAGGIAGGRSKKGEVKVHDQRYKAAAEAAAAAANNDVLTGPLREIELAMPIRYAQGDGVEAWLNKLLCLDSGSSAQLKLNGGAPAPSDCELYSVDRDALFSYHKLSEAFLQKLMGLYTSAHYKNTPNDLQMLSDAPAHSVFVLLSPSAEKDADSLPDILAVVQVALEGKISRKAVEAQLARGHRSAGDLIPWTISQQFGDSKFAQLSGARIVRIAVHPSVQSMGYGSRAVELLYRFYNGEIINLDNPGDESDGEDDASMEGGESGDDLEIDNEINPDMKGIRAEKLAPRKELPPLLLPLTEVEAPQLDWIGTSFGLTLSLHKFWSRAGMQMLYLRQTKNELTGEHSAIMVRALPKTTGVNDQWLAAFVNDTKRRFISLLSGPFRDMPIRTGISVLEKMAECNLADDRSETATGKVQAEELSFLLTPHDMKRLELYGRNLCDHHLVTDLLPSVSRLYFTGRFGSEFKLSSVQAAILCGIGVQNRDVDSLTKELGLPSNQVLAMFNKAVRKISIALNNIVEDKEKESLLSGEKRLKAEKAVIRMRNVASKTLQEDAAEAATDAIRQMNKMDEKALPPEIANDTTLMQYAIKGSDEQWNDALDGREVDANGTISIRSVREKRKSVDVEDFEKEAKSEHKTGSSRKIKKKKKAKRQ
jgi:N-acetyltransferase 10